MTTFKLDELEITAYPPHPSGMAARKPQTGIHILHKPSGYYVTCTRFRSQYKNKAAALESLKELLKLL